MVREQAKEHGRSQDGIEPGQDRQGRLGLARTNNEDRLGWGAVRAIFGSPSFSWSCQSGGYDGLCRRKAIEECGKRGQGFFLMAGIRLEPTKPRNGQKKKRNPPLSCQYLTTPRPALCFATLCFCAPPETLDSVGIRFRFRPGCTSTTMMMMLFFIYFFNFDLSLL